MMTSSEALQMERIEKKLDTLLQALGMGARAEKSAASSFEAKRFAETYKANPEGAKAALKKQNEERRKKGSRA
jgi:hypothetical protein